MGSAAKKPRPQRSKRSGKKSAKLYQANVTLVNELIRQAKEKTQ